MANYRGLVELRKEGFTVAECDRRMGPFVKDLYGFGDGMGYDKLHLKRKRLVNFCLEDVQAHIKKYLEGGVDKTTGKVFGPNEHLVHLIAEGFDLYIYSFVKRGSRGKRKLWECRKWQAILSPQGQVSFALEETCAGS
jgi:hypothetical protein